MGATKKENTNNLYLTIYDGAFRKWVKEKTETSKSRTKTNGKEVHEELYESVTGKLIKLYAYEEVINDATIILLVIYIKAENDKEATVIKTPINQSFAQSLLLRLPNLDLDKEFILKPYTIKNDDKSKEKGKEIYNDFLIPYQNNKKITNFYTKEEKNGLPEIVIKKDKNGIVKNVDRIERDEFLMELVINTDKIIQAKKKI